MRLRIRLISPPGNRPRCEIRDYAVYFLHRCIFTVEDIFAYVIFECFEEIGFCGCVGEGEGYAGGVGGGPEAGAVADCCDCVGRGEVCYYSLAEHKGIGDFELTEGYIGVDLVVVKV